MDKNKVFNEHFEDEVDLVNLLKPLYKNIKILVIAPIIMLLFSFALLKTISLDKYKCAAKLIVIKTISENAKKNGALNLQLYKGILISKSIKNQVIKKLKKQNLKKIENIDFEVKIYTKKRAEDQAISPIIRIIVTSPSAEISFKAVQIWIKLFLKTVTKLNKETNVNSFQIVDKKYNESKNSLNAVIKMIEKTNNKYLKKMNRLNEKKQNKLNEFDSMIMKKINKLKNDRQKNKLDLFYLLELNVRKYILDRNNLFGEMVKKFKPDSIDVQFKEINKTYSDYVSKIKIVDAEIETENQIINKLNEVLKKTDKTLVLKEKHLLFSSSKETVNTHYTKINNELFKHQLKLSSLVAEKFTISKAFNGLKRKYEDVLMANENSNASIKGFQRETEEMTIFKNKENEYTIEKYDRETDFLLDNMQNERKLLRYQLENCYNEQIEKLNSEKEIEIQKMRTEKKLISDTLGLIISKFKLVSFQNINIDIPVKIAVGPKMPMKRESNKILKKLIIIYCSFVFMIVIFIYTKEFYENNKKELKN